MPRNAQLIQKGLLCLGLLGTFTLATVAQHSPEATLPKQPVGKAPVKVDPTVQWFDPATSTSANLSDFGKVPVYQGEGGIAGGCVICTNSENEPNCGLPIPDVTNGGCNSTPNVFGAIAIGQTVCGTAGSNATHRDTDWWKFTVTTPTAVTWSATGEFPVQLLLIGPFTACPAPAAIGVANFAACTPGSILSAVLAPGDYIAFIGCQPLANQPCSDYTATLGVPVPEGRCCVGATCSVTTEANCTGDWTINETCPSGSYIASNCGNVLDDIAATGTSSTVTGTDDGTQTGVPIGFSFPFYGNNFTTCSINNNGFISFDTIATGFFTNAAIPTADAPNNLVAPLWDDLDSRIQGQILYQTKTSPNRFIVQWNNIQRYNQQPGSNTFQLILFDTGAIEFRYGAIEGSPPLTANAGVENATGTVGTSIDAAAIGTGATCRSLVFDEPPSPCVEQCLGDTDGNGIVNVDDLVNVILQWNCATPPGPCPADTDNSGLVDVDDLVNVILDWNCGV